MPQNRKLWIAAAVWSLTVVVALGNQVFAQGRPGGGRRGPGMGPPDSMRGGPPGEGRGWPGPPGGDQRRGPPDGRFGGRPGEGDSRGGRFEGFLRSMDANGNGMIEANEVDGRRRDFVVRMAERAGMEPKLPISVDGLQKAMQNRERGDSRADRPDDGRRDRDRSDSESEKESEDNQKKPGPTEEPLVPGFGVETSLAPVPTFGERVDKDGSSPARSPSRNDSRNRSSGSSRREGDSRVRRYAEGLLRQYDRNRNNRLEKDEWSRMSRTHWSADRDHDGVITLDELTHRLGEYSRGDSQGGDPRSPDGSGPYPPAKKAPYRFRTPTERWPEGIPDWFAQKDTDEDGQVAMAEYASDWSTDRAARANIVAFARWDLNQDGIITPDECLAAGEREPPEAVREDNKDEKRPEEPKGPGEAPEQGEPRRWTGW